MGESRTARANALPSGTLSLEINGTSRAVDAPFNVARLLETLELGDKRVAVAVNRDVVLRSRYPETTLSNGDRIEILEAVGGG